MSRRCAGVYPARYGASLLPVAESTRSTVNLWISSAARGSSQSRSCAARERRAPPSDARPPESARAQAELGVEQLRDSRARSSAPPAAPSRGRPPSPRCRQRARELARIRDRRRREQELWARAVDTREPAQAAEHVPDMRAEDASVDVRFVDHDVSEVVQHVRPAVVMRQDADVQHVGVREDHVRPAADLPAPLCPACPRRRSRRERSAHATRPAPAPDLARAPSSDRDRAPAPSVPVRSRRAPAD